MKVAIYGTGIIATLLLFTAGIIFNSHRIAAVWIIFATIVTYALSFSLYWHDDIKSKPRLKEPMFAENTENFTFSLGERGFSIGYSKKALEKNHINTGFVFGDYHPVDLYIENGKLYADVKIYGGSGLPPIEIKKTSCLINHKIGISIQMRKPWKLLMTKEYLFINFSIKNLLT